jgi:hypothetical protein
MIVRIKIPGNTNDEKAEKIFLEFEEENDSCLKLLSFGKRLEDSECIYSLLNEKEKKSLLNILTLNGIEVISTDDFTDEFINILLSNKMEGFREELDYESALFDELIEYVYLNEITKENILDKINGLGIDSLNENDYKVLTA